MYCGQTVGCIKMKLAVQVRLGPGHIVLDGDRAAPPKGAQPPQLSAHACCGQTAGWIKMPLGRDVGHIVLNGDPASPPKWAHHPNFWPMSDVAKRRLDGSRCHQ